MEYFSDNISFREINRPVIHTKPVTIYRFNIKSGRLTEKESSHDFIEMSSFSKDKVNEMLTEIRFHKHTNSHKINTLL